MMSSPSRMSTGYSKRKPVHTFLSAARRVQTLNIATRRNPPTRSSLATQSSMATRSNMGTRSSRQSGSVVARKMSRVSLVSGAIGTPSEQVEKAVPEELEALFNRCETIEASVKLNTKKVEQTHAAVKSEVKKFRKQVNDILDVWENEIDTQITDIMEVDIAHLASVLEETKKLIDEMQNSTDKVTEYQTKLLEINVIETEAKNVYREYKFTGNDAISELIKTESCLGDIDITQDVAGLYNDIRGIDNFVPTLQEEIHVKSDHDAFDCDITGMTMISAHKLIITDADNKSVKSVDTVAKKVTSSLQLPSGPWDVTMVHRGQIAVTIPSEKLIQYIMTTGGLTLDHHIKVAGECHGITYFRDSLVVSFRYPGKVQIMDLKGRVLKLIKMDASQNKIFDWPDYLAVSKIDGSIYVSDWQRNTVTRLSWKGEVTGLYKDGPGTKMAGVAVAEDGSVYVCKRTSHSIIKLNPDCSDGKLVLEEKHGLKFPWSLCFCDEESTLYVDNNRNSNTVAVFEMR